MGPTSSRTLWTAFAVVALLVLLVRDASAAVAAVRKVQLANLHSPTFNADGRELRNIIESEESPFRVNKRNDLAPYDPTAPNQAAPPSQSMRQEMLDAEPSTSQNIAFPDGSDVLLSALNPSGKSSDRYGPSVSSMIRAANNLMARGRDTGITVYEVPPEALENDDGVDWVAYSDGFITISVEFMREMAMNNVVLATWIYLGAAHQILNGVTEDTRRIETVMTPGFNIFMVSPYRPSGSEVVQPGPETSPRPPGGNMNTSGTYVMDRANPNPPWFLQPSIQVAVCGDDRSIYVPGKRWGPIERTPSAKRCVRKCKDCTNGKDTATASDEPKGTGGFTFTVPRRDNESVWIDPESGWQAVQASDYLAIKPSTRVAQWADRLGRGGFADDGEVDTAFAGLLFGKDIPNVDEQGFARSVLLGQVGSRLPLEPAPSAESELPAKRDSVCQGEMEVSSSRDDGIYRDVAEAAYSEMALNSLKRLPDDWNSIKVLDAYISWSHNSNCNFFGGCKKSRFNGGSTPAFEEVLPFFRRFIDEAKWGWAPGMVRLGVRYLDAILGQIQQALCISATPKGCTNSRVGRSGDLRK
ncbi:hypothetical protein CspHIS471_0611130 [Cutaneotrichosporon sp. HIS471]|nr:hypothetical protein CspHIS471_0611130 [Cutaneotrichosporon sp. HIS471]